MKRLSAASATKPALSWLSLDAFLDRLARVPHEAVVEKRAKILGANMAGSIGARWQITIYAEKRNKNACTRFNHPAGEGCKKKGSCSLDHKCVVCGDPAHGAFFVDAARDLQCPYVRALFAAAKQRLGKKVTLAVLSSFLDKALEDHLTKRAQQAEPSEVLGKEEEHAPVQAQARAQAQTQGKSDEEPTPQALLVVPERRGASDQEPRSAFDEPQATPPPFGDLLYTDDDHHEDEDDGNEPLPAWWNDENDGATTDDPRPYLQFSDPIRRTPTSGLHSVAHVPAADVTAPAQVAPSNRTEPENRIVASLAPMVHLKLSWTSDALMRSVPWRHYSRNGAVMASSLKVFRATLLEGVVLDEDDSAVGNGASAVAAAFVELPIRADDHKMCVAGIARQVSTERLLAKHSPHVLGVLGFYPTVRVAHVEYAVVLRDLCDTNLAEYVERNATRLQRDVQLTRDVCAALTSAVASCHEAGFAHGHLVSESVFVEERRSPRGPSVVVRLTDFAEARPPSAVAGAEWSPHDAFAEERSAPTTKITAARADKWMLGYLLLRVLSCGGGLSREMDGDTVSQLTRGELRAEVRRAWIDARAVAQAQRGSILLLEDAVVRALSLLSAEPDPELAAHPGMWADATVVEFVSRFVESPAMEAAQATAALPSEPLFARIDEGGFASPPTFPTSVLECFDEAAAGAQQQRSHVATAAASVVVDDSNRVTVWSMLRMLRNVVAHCPAPLGMSRTRRVQSIVRATVDAYPIVFLALWDARNASKWVAVHEVRGTGVRLEFL